MDKREQLEFALEGLDDPDLLRKLGEGGLSVSLGIQGDPRALSSVHEADPAMVGAALVIRRLEELWADVRDERLWGLMLANLFELVIDEWETSRRQQGPWKLVLDAHLLLGKRQGWLDNRSQLPALMFGKSTAQLVQLNADMATGRLNLLPAQKSGGCYIATAVYGSYDAPDVLVLRRFRDEILSTSLLGRMFIRSYYLVSPQLVRHGGGVTRRLFRRPLRLLVRHLREQGVSDTPHFDSRSH